MTSSIRSDGGNVGKVDLKDISSIKSDTEDTLAIPNLFEGVHNVATNISDMLGRSSADKPIAPAIILSAILSVVVGATLSPQTGLLVGLLVALTMLGEAGITKIAALAAKAISEMTKPPEETSSNTKLDDKIYQKALETGEAPEDFFDSVTGALIKDPVGFTTDPHRTVYERSTIAILLEDNKSKTEIKNPFVPGQKLNIRNLVALPGIKGQIDGLVKQHPKILEDDAKLEEES